MLSGMGAVFRDYDNDGFPDVLVTQLPLQPYVVFHNDSRGVFSAQELEAGCGTRDGYGARVQVNGQVRFATATGSYLSSNDKRLHFGLGSAVTADVEIRWPSGIHQVLRGVKADQFLVVEESALP
jgi:enediyne biosynthesis protein E4